MKDVVVVISDVEGEAEGHPYAVAKVFRYDYEGTDEEFVAAIENLPGIIEGSQMRNE